MKPGLLSLPFLRRRAEEEIVSLPDLLIRAQQAAHSISTGEHNRRRAGLGDQFWQFRDYQAGDRPRDIDWRRSSRGDRVLIRQREEQRTQTILFWCAGDAGMNYRSESGHATKREAGLTLCLGAALLLQQAGERIGALQVADGRRATGNWEQLGNLLLDHAAVTLPTLDFQVPRHAIVIMAGDFLSPLPEIEASLQSLMASGNRVVLLQTLDPAELSLPFSGRVVFEDFSSSITERIDHVAAIRTAYRGRMDAHLADIAAFCRAQQWHWLLHTTDTPERETLADLWHFLAPDNPGPASSI